MSRNLRITLIFALLVAIGGLSSCRPRASRTSRAKKPATQSQTTPVGASISASQILSRTDSAIARVGRMMEDDAVPFATEPNLGLTSPSVPYVPRPNLNEYDNFEAGLGAFNSRNYDQAIANLSQVVLSGRPPELVPNAYYWMGESYYAMQRFAESLPYFEYTTKVGPQYRKETAFYKLSLANISLGNQQAAKLWYERLKAEFPKSQYAARLRKALVG